MRKALRTSMLILALCGSAYAGEIPNNPPVPPSGPATASETQTLILNEAQENLSAADVVTEAAMSLLQTVLAVF